jgi:3-oxoadipate enol-lactonase
VSDVVLIHAGVADSRMWTPQLESFGRDRRVIAPDLPGFGTHAYESDVIDFRGAVRDAMDAAGMERAALVGTSFGGMIALDLTLETPERVSALVLVGAGIDDHDWSDEMEELDNVEAAALQSGDFDTAADAMVRGWVVGPRRKVEAVDAEVRNLVAEMQRSAYALQEGHDVRSKRLDPPASQRLGDVHVPTLVLTGEEDFDDIRTMGDRLAAEIPGAERATIAHAAHLPSLERPDEFDRIVLGFLGQHGV